MLGSSTRQHHIMHGNINGKLCRLHFCQQPLPTLSVGVNYWHTYKIYIISWRAGLAIRWSTRKKCRQLRVRTGIILRCSLLISRRLALPIFISATFESLKAKKPFFHDTEPACRWPILKLSSVFMPLFEQRKYAISLNGRPSIICQLYHRPAGHPIPAMSVH